MATRIIIPAHGVLPAIPVFLVESTRALLWQMGGIYSACVGPNRLVHLQTVFVSLSWSLCGATSRRYDKDTEKNKAVINRVQARVFTEHSVPRLYVAWTHMCSCPVLCVSLC